MKGAPATARAGARAQTQATEASGCGGLQAWAFMMHHLITQEHLMPTYHIEMFEGRTPEQKKKLVEEITRVTVEVLGGSPESVDIIITDIQRANWATGGKLWSEPRG